MLDREVVQFESDFRLRPLFPDFEFISRVHVDRCRFDTLGCIFGTLFEWPSHLTRALPGGRIDHHRCVVVTLMKRAFVHGQYRTVDLAFVHIAKSVDILDHGITTFESATRCRSSWPLTATQ